VHLDQFVEQSHAYPSGYTVLLGCAEIAVMDVMDELERVYELTGAAVTAGPDLS
jgi:hypothetical protein